ncbi:hypothetical protein C0995_010761 [Termitomyces sp. Mi166|nr:hypothetical protein C0995_010761 [Termitomyces sp. Mi166\
MSDWGPPSASFPAMTCNVIQFFGPQKLVLDITLCGSWAGLPENYLPTCGNSGPTGICYNDNVVGPGDRFNNAYFEIRYVRAYTTGGVTPTPTAAVAVPAPPQTTSVVQTPLLMDPGFDLDPNGAVGLHMSRGTRIGLLLMSVGAAVGPSLCL